jgi:hypothetical protein
LPAFDLTRLSGAFLFIGEPFAAVGGILARVRFAVSRGRESVASIGRRFAHLHVVLSQPQARLAPRGFDLVRLRRRRFGPPRR